MLPRIVPVEDEEVSKELERVFKKSKIRVETGAKCDNVEKTGTGVKMKVTLSNGKVEQVEAEKLLVASIDRRGDERPFSVRDTLG